MNTPQTKHSNFTGILLVLFVAWLLFGNGLTVVLLFTQQLQQRLAQQHQPIVLTVPTAQVPQPTAAADVHAQPLQPGQLPPLTLDPQPAQQQAQPAAPIPTAAPIQAQAVDVQPQPTAAPAPQVQAQVQQQVIPTATAVPTQEPTSKPVVAEATAMPLNARGEPDWNALAAALPTAKPHPTRKPTAAPQVAAKPTPDSGWGQGAGSGGSWDDEP